MPWVEQLLTPAQPPARRLQSRSLPLTPRWVGGLQSHHLVRPCIHHETDGLADGFITCSQEAVASYAGLGGSIVQGAMLPCCDIMPS